MIIMSEHCPLCSKLLKNGKERSEEVICDNCADVLEFGYPSFPAYALEG